MEILPDQSQSVIKCRNSQGLEVQANLLRLTRYAVVFEVYNPYSILQLSEVLSDFRILANKRLIYRGKAVVSNLLNTGLVLVCEAGLEDGWQEVDFLSGVSGESDLGGQFRTFMQEWKSANHVQDAFKVVVADMSSALTGVQHWMGGIDVGIRSTATRRREDLEREIFSNVQRQVVEEVVPAMERFEEISANIGEEDMPSHKSYVRRELHPIVLCSPFLYRTYTKPLGYAGDYEMVNMMLRDPYEGASPRSSTTRCSTPSRWSRTATASTTSSKRWTARPSAASVAARRAPSTSAAARRKRCCASSRTTTRAT
jgi:extracellular factor (EF) 3-hydroxypalmitic acid methyl ester biosynthesis protein